MPPRLWSVVRRAACAVDTRVFSLKKMSVDDAILWHLHVMELRNDILKHLSKKFGYPIQVRLLESTPVPLIAFCAGEVYCRVLRSL